MRLLPAAARKSRTTRRPANSPQRATTAAGRPGRSENHDRETQPTNRGLVTDGRPSPGEVADQLRASHRASLTHPGYCWACPSCWPCETRLRADEVCPAAQQLYAAQVHAGWLAGVRTCRAS
jgi:hypothetical protein